MRSFTLSDSHPILRSFLIGLILFTTALVVSWPLPVHLTDALPLGTEQELTVPLFNTWTLWWVADRAAHSFANFWQAPIFYPSEGSFTFSEPQPLTGLLVLPLWSLFKSPLPVYNLAVLLCLFLNGTFAYRLGRALEFPRFPSLIGGMLVIGLPMTAKLLGVLPLIPLFGMLWALEGFVRFGREGSWKMALWAGTGLLVQLFTSQQLALLFSLFVVPAGLFALYQQKFSHIATTRLGSVGLGVLLLTAWYGWYPFHLHQTLEFSRSEELVRLLSAHPHDYLTKPLTASFPFPSREDLQSDTGGLFPGFGLLILTGIGCVWGIRKSKNPLWVGYFLMSGAIAFVLSLGLNVTVGSWHPFNWIREWLPGFHEFRSPFRFGIIVQICLALLSVWGLASLSRSPHILRNWALVGILGLACLMENLTTPQPITVISSDLTPPWATWANGQQESQTLVHIPFPNGLHVSDFEIEAKRMLAQIIHRKPLVNGYSGYFPPGYDQFQLDMARNFPSVFLLCFLQQELHADTLVIDRPWYKTHQSQMTPYTNWFQSPYQDDEVVILTLKNGSHDCKSQE